MAFRDLRRRAERDKWTKTGGGKSTMMDDSGMKEIQKKNKAKWTKVEKKKSGAGGT